MSQAQQEGFDYLWSYSGLLKLSEATVGVILITILAIWGVEMKAYILSTLSIYAFTSGLLLLILHVKGIVRKMILPWFWIECINALFLMIAFALASSVVMSTLLKSYIIAAIVGYILTVAYFFHTLDSYQLAITPRARYVWTTPNMPE